MRIHFHLFSISSCKVLKNISTSDEPTAALTSSLLPVLTECAFLGNPETKPRREATQEPGVQCEQDRKNICEAVVWEELTGNPSSLQRKHRHEEPEVCAPQRKRRCIPASLLHGDTHHSLEAWSQDPLFSYSQCTEDTVDLGDNDIGRTRNLSDNQLSQSDRLQSERAFGPHLAAAETTSTHNPLKQTSSVPDSEKENGGCSLYLSPKKHLVHSYIDHLRHEVRQQDHADRENNSDSQFEWTKPRTSPLRKPKLPHKTDDDDSLSMLFTQDSEGLRVIAHRSWQVRSPLKDHSNMTRATRSVSSSSKALVAEKEEEDDMLFTQDSQGNLVIKH